MHDGLLLRDVLVQTHVVAGFASLLFFWIPLLTRKGSTPHKRFGILFYYVGCYTAITAVITAVWALIVYEAPVAGDGNSGSQDLGFLYAALLFLGMAIFADLRMGVRLVRTKNAPERLGTPFDKSVRVVTGLIALWLLGFGIWRLAFTGGHGGYILCVVLGAIGVLGTPGTLKFLANPSPTPRQWLYKHIEAMIGCGAGFHVAFVLFGFRRLAAMQWSSGVLSLAVVVAPFVAGFLAVHFWTRSYKLKFGD